jgi:hypothetical protein
MGSTSRPTFRALAATLIAALLAAPAAAQSADDDAARDAGDYAAIAFDAAIVRPLGVSVVVVGAAFFVPAAILAAPGGMTPIREAWQQFVLAPVNFVFRRPLGDF